MKICARLALPIGLAVTLSACGGGSVTAPPAGPAFAPPGQATTLYVGSGTGAGKIATMAATANGTVTPTTLIEGATASLGFNYFAAVDAQGQAWTTNCMSINVPGPVSAFAAGATGDVAPAIALEGSNTTFSGCQTGIAIDAAGNTIVGDLSNLPGYPGGHIAIFAAGANGNVAPARVIAGTSANFHSPTGIAVDGLGNIYVADSGLGYSYSGDVAVFASGASGDVAPSAVIAGSATGLSTPEGVALDARGNIYVANLGNATVTVYAAHASGNAAPIRTIGGGLTGLDQPVGIAVDAAGYVYVGSQASAPLQVFAPGATGDVAPVQSIAINATQFLSTGVAVR